MAISQNAILSKWQSPKSLHALNFSINWSETFRIDVNMNFANDRFLMLAPKIIRSQILKKRGIFGFQTIFFGGPNQKSVMISIYEIQFWAWTPLIIN